MDIQIIVAVIGVGSALFGSAIGGLGSYLSTRSMRKLEWKLAQVEREIVRREALYSEFLGEANKWILTSFEQRVASISEMNHLINLESHIQLTSPELGGLAREIAACVLEHHDKNKKEKRQYSAIRDQFVDECRRELVRLREVGVR